MIKFMDIIPDELDLDSIDLYSILDRFMELQDHEQQILDYLGQANDQKI